MDINDYNELSVAVAIDDYNNFFVDIVDEDDHYVAFFTHYVDIFYCFVFYLIIFSIDFWNYAD